MKKISVNGTEIVVEVKEGKTFVNITTEDADILVNNSTIWSKYDKPEYMEVPVLLRSFIEEKTDFIQVEETQVVTDLWMKGNRTCATFYIPKNKRTPIVARIDLFSSMEELDDYIRNNSDIDGETADQLVKDFKELFKEIEDAVNEAGYTLRFSHATGDTLGGWWDVVFKLKDWNEESFMTIWKKFSNFETRLHEFIEKYNM